MIFDESSYLSFAIQSLKPNSEFTFNDADYSTINWIVLDGIAPTKKEIETEIARLKKQYAQDEINREVKRNDLLVKLGITAEEAKLLLS